MGDERSNSLAKKRLMVVFFTKKKKKKIFSPTKTKIQSVFFSGKKIKTYFLKTRTDGTGLREDGYGDTTAMDEQIPHQVQVKQSTRSRLTTGASTAFTKQMRGVPTRIELIDIFKAAMDQGDIRILELIMDKVREVFELEASWRRHFVDFVVYDALSNFLNTRSGSTEIWKYVQSLSPSGYSVALAKAHMMNDVDSMKYILENGLITDRNIVQMNLRYFLDTTESEERKSPGNPQHRVMLEWLREEITKW